MNGVLRSAVGGVMAMVMALSPAVAAEKTYEKPSVFLKRHFGDVPKTRVLELDRRQRGGLKAALGHDYGQTRIRYWKEGDRTAWILDEIGKTEPITSGVVVDQGRVERVRVLVFRESRPPWRSPAGLR